MKVRFQISLLRRLSSSLKLKYFSSSLQSGFTIIELLVVFTIMGILTTLVIASFSKYNSSQVFNTSVASVVDLLNRAKSEAMSQVKPKQCISTNQALRGYQVVVDPSTGKYELDAVCSSASYVIESRKLPPNYGVSFVAAGTTTTTFFSVLTGSVPQNCTIKITNLSTTKTITITTASKISVM